MQNTLYIKFVYNSIGKSMVGGVKCIDEYEVEVRVLLFWQRILAGYINENFEHLNQKQLVVQI